MAIYELWREADDKDLGGEEAQDAAHAAAIFSQRLGVELTLEEGDAAPEYMMRRVQANEVIKGRKFDIPVWVRSN